MDLYAEVERLLEMQSDAVIATIVHTRGSTPREIGARMIIEPDGTAMGTVGGGCGEAEVWAEAMEVAKSGVPRCVEVDLLHDQDPEGGRACGGLMYVFIEPLRPDLKPAAGTCDNPGEALTETSKRVSLLSESGLV
jgi:xanthine/CO dehydrogenase XdhC/CoxF family maturation factor